MALEVHESRRSCEECMGCTQVTGDTIITQPGCYYVTKNIAGAGNEVILIQADNVSLDLKGHTLTLPGAGPGSAIIRIDAGFTGISIRNGTLSGARRGVTQAAHATKRSRIHLKNLTVKDYTSEGIHFTGPEQVDLIDSRVISTTNHAVMVIPGGGTFTGHFLRNTLRGANSNVLLLDGLNGGIVRGNQATGEGDQVGIGVTGDSNIIEGNTIWRVHGWGIYVDGLGNLVANNTVNSGRTGIYVKKDDNRITGNVVHKCHESGIRIEGSRNLIEGNHASEQLGSFGLQIVSGTDNAYRNNMFRGNDAGAISDPGGNTDAGGNIV